MNLTATSAIRVFVYAIVLGSSLGRFSLYAQCPVNLNVSVAQNATGQYVATIDTNGTWLDYSYRNTGSSIPGPDSHMEVVLDTTCQASAELLTVRVGKAGCEQVAESTQSVGPPDTTPQLKLTAEGNWVNAYVTVPNATAPSIQAVEFKYAQIPRVSFSGVMLWGPGATVGQGPGAVLAEARSCTGRISVDTASVGTTCDEETSQKCDTCSECVGTPVHTLSGSMTYDETEPIAGLDWLPFRLTYNSVQTQVGPFGAGWHSLFSSKFAEYTGIGGTHYVAIYTERGAQYLFAGDGTAYSQIHPKTGTRSTLTRVNDTFKHTDADGTIARTFVSGTLTAYTNVATGRTLNISWDSGRPASVSDSWGVASATIATDATTGLITAIIPDADPALAWTYVYDGTHLKTTISPEGVWRNYEYGVDYFGRLQELAAVRDGKGRLIERHTYVQTGANTSEQQTDDIVGITHDQPGRVQDERLSSITYRSGRVERHFRRFVAGKWRVVEVEDGCASCATRARIVAFDAAGNVTRKQLEDGHITRSTYDQLGRLSSERTALRPQGCDPLTDQLHCRQSPDALAVIELEDTLSSLTTSYRYDDPIWFTRPTQIATDSVLRPGESRTESVMYHPVTGEVTQRMVTGWTGHPARQETHVTTTAVYDGTEGSAFNPGGAFDASWAALAQPLGRPKSIDGPRTDVTDSTSFVYYPIADAVPPAWRGRLAAIRTASGHQTRYEDYDPFGNPRRTIDPNGVVTISAYDRLGRRTGATVAPVSACDTASDPLCATSLTSSTVYDGSGPVATQLAATGDANTFAYDDRGRLATISRGPSATDLRERVRFDYDPATGRKSHETVEAFRAGAWVETRRTDYDYDPSGRISAVIAGDGSRVTYRYGSDGRLADVQDENHSQANTIYSYDAAGRLSGVQQTAEVASDGTIETAYAYDRHGNLTAVTDPNGNVTTYEYDDFGRMMTQVSPTTGTTTYSYDEAGNLLLTTDANDSSTSRSYDAVGRVLTQDSSRGSEEETVTWSYDDAPMGVGRLATATDATGTTTYRYDRRGLLLQEAKTIDGTTYVTRYTYDRAGRTATLTYPSGTAVQYTYDFAGRPVSASANGVPLVTDAKYLPFGPPEEVMFANGTRRVTMYDARYRFWNHRLAKDAIDLAAFRYGHDPVGNITSIEDLIDPGYNRTFAYDDLNRLVGADTGNSLWGLGTYRYDPMGNMVTSTLGVNQKSFSYPDSSPRLNLVTESGTARTVTYDAAGNEATVGSETFTYSPRNHLARDGRSRYEYDFRGIRTVASRPGALLSLTLPIEVAGGTDGEGTVTLYSAAPNGGALVNLEADGMVAGVPPSVTIPEGALTTTFVVTTSPVVASTDVTIRASYDGVTLSGAISVEPPALSALTLAGVGIKGGQSLNATVSLDAPAPAGGILVTLSSSDPAHVSVPESVTIAEGAAETTFSFDAPSPVPAEVAVSIVAEYADAQRSAMVTVQPPSISSLTLSPASMEGGRAAGAVVQLESAAAGGTVITFESTSAATQPPAAVTMPAGATSVGASVITAPVGAITSAVVTAHLPPGAARPR